jgi:predicted nucleic acid-binding protein
LAGLVLDSYALLAYLRDEKGARLVERALDRAREQGVALQMTEVNYAEVQYITRRKEGDDAWRAALEIIEGLPIEFAAADRSLAELAAGYKSGHKMSLADAFAAALATREGLPLMTGDPEFKPLAKAIKIEWL